MCYTIRHVGILIIIINKKIIAIIKAIAVKDFVSLHSMNGIDGDVSCVI